MAGMTNKSDAARITTNQSIERTLTMEILQPPNWPRPQGFSNGIAARGSLVFIAGQIGWDEKSRIVSADFSAQVRQALVNVLAVLAEGGGKPEHIARMTWYVTDKREYLAAYKSIGEVYRGLMGRHFPAMTAVEVAALIEDGAKVEIEATAVVPD
jgi:enamine deaminase RidA (YjgF/YER057c/UK114 family)